MSQFVVLNLNFGKSFTEKVTFEERSSYWSEFGGWLLSCHRVLAMEMERSGQI